VQSTINPASRSYKLLPLFLLAAEIDLQEYLFYDVVFSAWACQVSMPSRVYAWLNLLSCTTLRIHYAADTMVNIAVVQLFDATDSTSYYDIWCDRGLIVARLQLFLAAAYAIALTADKYVPNTNVYYNEPIPDWEKVVAIVPICLAAINCPIRSLLRLRLFGFHHDELQRLLVFAVSQAIQLLLCTLLTVADFIRHGSAPLFWLSLVLWFLPAALAFVHGVTGLYAICSRCGPYIELGPSEPHPQYNDLDDDDGPLAMAFHLQQDLSHAANEEDTTEPTMTALLDRDANEIRRPRVSHSLMRDNENRPATRANLMFQRYWHGHATLETTCSSTRFRWQEKLKNLKDGGMVFWLPFTTAIGLSMVCGQSYSFTIRHTRYVTPEFKR
jgi:hypothetical protein